jgi:hypothetical protein
LGQNVALVRGETIPLLGGVLAFLVLVIGGSLEKALDSRLSQLDDD